MEKRKEAIGIREDRGPINGQLQEIRPMKVAANLSVMARMKGISQEERRNLLNAVTLIVMKYSE